MLSTLRTKSSGGTQSAVFSEQYNSTYVAMDVLRSSSNVVTNYERKNTRSVKLKNEKIGMIQILASHSFDIYFHLSRIDDTFMYK